jgi:hypothetical protein
MAIEDSGACAPKSIWLFLAFLREGTEETPPYGKGSSLTWKLKSKFVSLLSCRFGERDDGEIPRRIHPRWYRISCYFDWGALRKPDQFEGLITEP